MAIFYQTAPLKRFRGYLLLASDTSCQLLPDSEETQKMGVHTNQHKTVASIKISTCFDLLNSVYFRASTHPKQTADLRCIQPSIKDKPKDTLSIYDRGFGSILLLFLHQYYQSKCLVRLKLDFSTYVKDFVKSTDNERIVSVSLGKKCSESLKGMGIDRCPASTISVRLIKVILSTSEVEVLMTNVAEDELSIKEAGVLYGLRWGVETAYNYTKNIFKLGIFSGYSAQVILQDIWCTLIAQNLENMLLFETEKSLIAINKKRKKVYKINKAVGAGTIVSEIRNLFKCPISSLQNNLERIKQLLLMSLEKVKSESKKRERKRQRPNDRHTTEKNYKHNF